MTASGFLKTNHLQPDAAVRSVCLYEADADNREAFRSRIGERFTAFKHADPEAIEWFSLKLTDLILKQIWPDAAVPEWPMLCGNAVPENCAAIPVIACPAFDSVLTPAVRMALQIGRELSRRVGVKLPVIQLSRRHSATDDFSHISDAAERRRRLMGTFDCVPGSLVGRHVLFIDDTCVSGAHFSESIRVLVERCGVNAENVIGCFVVKVKESSAGEMKCEIESWLNCRGDDAATVMSRLLNCTASHSTLSPRCLKLAIERCEQTLNWLQQAPLPVARTFAYSFCSGCRADGLLDDPRVVHMVDRIESLIDLRMHRQRASLPIVWVRRLTDADMAIAAITTAEDRNGTGKSLQDTACEFHPTFRRPLSFAEVYSCFKFGDPICVRLLADRLAGAIRTQLGQRLHDESHEWAVAAPGYRHSIGCAMLLAEAVSDILQLPITRLLRQSGFAESYGASASSLSRGRMVDASFYDVEHCGRPRLILIDDAIVSGANLLTLLSLCHARQDVSEVLPACVVDLQTTRLELEEQLNQCLISSDSPEQLLIILSDRGAIFPPGALAENQPAHTTAVASPLQDTDPGADRCSAIRQHPAAVLPFLMRTAKFLLQLPGHQRADIYSRLSARRLAEFITSVRLTIPHSAEVESALQCAQGFLPQHGGRLPRHTELHIAFAVTADMQPEIGTELSHLFSKFKYGDSEATEFFCGHLCRQISHVFQRGLPAGCVVASTFFHRVANAARALGERIASELGLPLIDLHRRRIFPGEFGALASLSERSQVLDRNCYLPDTSSVVNRHVIYIDDAVVSGAHLQAHVDTLLQAGAKSVTCFALMRLPDSDLTLESRLNRSAVSDLAALLPIMQDPDSRLLTRSIKLVLNAFSDDRHEFLASLADDQLFELYEAAVAEGYGRIARFSSAMQQLEAIVLARHLRVGDIGSPVPSASCDDRNVITGMNSGLRAALFDLDGTLGPVLTPVSDEMLAQLYRRLQADVCIALISSQPIQERGVIDFFVRPFLHFLDRRQLSPSPLQNVLLLPSDGAYVYAFDSNGDLLRDGQPLVQYGFLQDEFDLLAQLVMQTAPHAVRTFLRGAYISLHFASAGDLIEAQAGLNEVLADFLPAVDVAPKPHTDPEKHILHIRLAGHDKSVGRWLALSLLKRRSALLGKPLQRSQILVAGDQMGTIPSELSDTRMIVHGATNLALGTTRHPACRQTDAPSGPAGLLRFLAECP